MNEQESAGGTLAQWRGKSITSRDEGPWGQEGVTLQVSPGQFHMQPGKPNLK